MPKVPEPYSTIELMAALDIATDEHRETPLTLSNVKMN
jgi:hypothetical protein